MEIDRGADIAGDQHVGADYGKGCALSSAASLCSLGRRSGVLRWL
jgi:hypothetical protein